ncbi:MAG: glutamate mutase L [Chloroflexi bacterium]|nr:glutamate mutase L [Chloroflexota bacterium]MCL5075064.1 glutamate mutase L [Chloroflexota bacterium]
MTGSILLGDLGSTTTKLSLLDLVEGRHRFIARGEVPTTLHSPIEDVSCGIRAAASEIEAISGRKLFDTNGLITPEREDGSGVDLFLCMASVRGPLRLVVVGTAARLSTESALRAASGVDALVLGRISLDEIKPQDKRVMQIIHDCRPDALLIAGGTEGGAKGELIALAQLLASDERCSVWRQPSIVFAGNSDIAPWMERILGERYDLRHVANLRPTLTEENLEPARSELRRIWQERLLSDIPGYATLQSWLSIPPVSIWEAFASALRFLSVHYGVNVLGVDIGGNNTSIISVTKEGTTSRLRVGLGTGRGATALLEFIPDVARWLPLEGAEDVVYDAIWNKWGRPWTIPETRLAVQVEGALAREVVRQVAQATVAGQQSQPCLIVGRGAVLSNAPSPGFAALLLLDALMPAGSSELAIDHLGLLPQLGVLAGCEPRVAGQALLGDGLLRLGTCISPVGDGRIGSRALTVKVTYSDRKDWKTDIPFGRLICLPLEGAREARVIVEPARGLDVGQGKDRKARFMVGGGALRLIIDARGRPFSLACSDTERTAKIQEWAEAMSVYGSSESISYCSRSGVVG